MSVAVVVVVKRDLSEGTIHYCTYLLAFFQNVRLIHVQVCFYFQADFMEENQNKDTRRRK